MIPKSNELRFEVTTKCNYKCSICPRDMLTRKIETMSFELFKSLLDKILAETDQYDTLTFPGMGEPLLDNTLEEKIKYARSKGLAILILTNGYFLSVDRFKGLEKLGVDSIRVSFYGNTPESYAKIHGVERNVYDKVKNNITEICKIKKNTKILMTYNSVENINDSDLQSWIAYWKDKVDLLEVWKPHNWASAMNYRKVQKEKLNSCGRPWNTPLQVQVDGTINMCCFDYDGKLTLGDLKTQSLKEIFSSTTFEKIKDCHSTGNYSNSGLICENCDQRNKDKSDVMIYNSKFDIKERVKQVSTTYKKVVI